MPFAGFPRDVHFTPVPGPLFGPLLEQIDDLGELKCTLRLIWLLHQKRGSPRYVTLREMQVDRVLAKALATQGDTTSSELARAMTLAVRRGTVVSGHIQNKGAREQAYALNTELDRRALESTVVEGQAASLAEPGVEPWDGATERPNIFALYEDNIGMLSPMIAEELKEAEKAYPESWIEDAIREAVSSNKRSWRYISRILERWERDGRSDGEPGRYPKKAGYPEHLRR